MKNSLFVIALLMGAGFSTCNVCDASHIAQAPTTSGLPTSFEEVSLDKIERACKNLDDMTVLYSVSTMLQYMKQIWEKFEDIKARSKTYPKVLCSRDTLFDEDPGAKLAFDVITMPGRIDTLLNGLWDTRLCLEDAMKDLYTAGTDPDSPRLCLLEAVKSLLNIYVKIEKAAGFYIGRMVLSGKLSIPENLYQPRDTLVSEAKDACSLIDIHFAILKSILPHIGFQDALKEIETFHKGGWEAFLPIVQGFVNKLAEEVKKATMKS